MKHFNKAKTRALSYFRACLVTLLVFAGFVAPAQTHKAAKGTDNRNPATFTISKTDFANLFTKQSNEIISASQNKYIDKSRVIINTINGDMKFMKIKLNYFKKAFLMIQVNGAYSTQIFILSEDKSVFYKGKIDNGLVTMVKCDEDEIVSE